jgi:predicted ATPase
MRIHSIKVKNFKALQDIEIQDMTNLTVIVGKNGVGKTTFFDIFDFLQDCLEKNVNEAIKSRGGYREVVSRGNESENIIINICVDIDEQNYSYYLALEHNEPTTIIKRESLYLIHKNGDSCEVVFENVRGECEVYLDIELKTGKSSKIYLDSPSISVLKGLGQFSEFPAIASFRKMVENWSVSDFNIRAAQNDNNPAVPAEHLSRSGDNLSQVAKFLYDNHRESFNMIINKMRERIPGISDITVDTTVDNRLVLRFKDGTFKDPFLSKNASDGTMKMFAYLVMLNDPNPYPLICIEEPENQLYPKVLGILAEEFREFSERGQVFVSTHSPDFLNAIEIEEVVLLEKSGGYTKARRLCDDKEISSLFEYGDKLGWLWNQGYFQPPKNSNTGV